ncbi:ferredoxin [Amycolatopsis circi]|uniref:ferredoxin n=1 Tax=Amycolatopsis circi TaxID=871959 RepID=UPI000E222E00|nr:ferredoxin [Amycolatopsis circi]
MRVIVDHAKCTGLGLCESVAEDVFEVQEDGSLRLLVQEICPSRRAEIQEAVDSCPTEALRLVD